VVDAGTAILALAHQLGGECAVFALPLEFDFLLGAVPTRGGWFG
jgi:hypothetical protein